MFSKEAAVDLEQVAQAGTLVMVELSVSKDSYGSAPGYS